MADQLKKQDQADNAELDDLQAESLPDRENMSLVDANVAVPVNAGVAANVLSDHSTATATAHQATPIAQTNRG